MPTYWEQQGFGGYNYGQDDLTTRHKEFGLYKHEFLAAEEWELTSESFYLTMTNVEKNDLAMVFKFELE